MSLLAMAVAAATSTTSSREVGCWWYPKQCVLPGMALTDRNIADLPAHTCTYINVGNLARFNVTADGHMPTDPWTESCIDSAAA